MKTRSPITTHVLDITLGRPAASVKCALEVSEGNNNWKVLSQKSTNQDGRIEDFLTAEHKLKRGHYRLVFETAPYFKNREIEAFFPKVELQFDVQAEGDHYHVPLLLSPFSYSTYRGS